MKIDGAGWEMVPNTMKQKPAEPLSIEEKEYPENGIEISFDVASVECKHI